MTMWPQLGSHLATTMSPGDYQCFWPQNLHSLMAPVLTRTIPTNSTPRRGGSAVCWSPGAASCSQRALWGKLSAVHGAPPQDEIPGHLHLCLMIIIKDWRGLFSADRWGILFSMQQGIVSLTRISPSMNFLESASDPEGYRWSLWTF